RTVAIWAHVGLMALDKIDADGVAFLKQCTNTDELLRVRVQAVRALGMVGSQQPRDVMPAIIEFLGDNDPEMAAAACMALGETGDAGAVEPLAKVARSAGRSAVVRVQAVRALGAIGAKSKTVAQPLMDLVTDPDHDVAANACVALGSIKEPPLAVEEK